MERVSTGEIILKLIILLVSYPVGLVLSVFIHELGHSLVALITTKQTVFLNIGRGQAKKSVRLGRLVVGTSFRSLQLGSTSYDRSLEGRGVQLGVALGGPLISLTVALLVGAFLKDIPLGTLLGLGLLAWFVANFRILIVSLWPIAYQPNKDDSEVWLSDGLDIWRLFRGK